MSQTHWLVYFKQRQYGRENWIEANCITDQHPTAFLMRLKEEHQNHESMVMWAIETPQELAEEAKDCIG